MSDTFQIVICHLMDCREKYLISAALISNLLHTYSKITVYSVRTSLAKFALPKHTLVKPTQTKLLVSFCQLK